MPFAPNERVYIIAEVGSNHYGSLDIAIECVKAAAKAGADAVKFQLFKLEDILKDPTKGERWWELPVAWLPVLQGLCYANKIDFVCTPFAPWAVRELDRFVDVWKIGSFEYHYGALWDAVSITKKPIIASTGRGIPLKWNVYELYCVSKYPTLDTDVDLSSFTLRGGDERPAGISDHTTSTMIPAIAVAAGARIVEKHFHPSGVYGGEYSPTSPDELHSLAPTAFAEMVNNVRYVEMLCRPKATPKTEFPNRLELS